MLLAVVLVTSDLSKGASFRDSDAVVPEDQSDSLAAGLSQVADDPSCPGVQGRWAEMRRVFATIRYDGRNFIAPEEPKLDVKRSGIRLKFQAQSLHPGQHHGIQRSLAAYDYYCVQQDVPSMQLALEEFKVLKNEYLSPRGGLSRAISFQDEFILRESKKGHNPPQSTPLKDQLVALLVALNDIQARMEASLEECKDYLRTKAYQATVDSPLGHVPNGQHTTTDFTIDDADGDPDEVPLTIQHGHLDDSRFGSTAA